MATIAAIVCTCAALMAIDMLATLARNEAASTVTVAMAIVDLSERIPNIIEEVHSNCPAAFQNALEGFPAALEGFPAAVKHVSVAAVKHVSVAAEVAFAAAGLDGYANVVTTLPITPIIAILVALGAVITHGALISPVVAILGIAAATGMFGMFTAFLAVSRFAKSRKINKASIKNLTSSMVDLCGRIVMIVEIYKVGVHSTLNAINFALDAVEFIADAATIEDLMDYANRVSAVGDDLAGDAEDA